MDEITHTDGYFRHPSLSQHSLVFVAEDSLWQVAPEGGEAHRLTNNPGLITRPHFSPDGKWLAYSSAQEGSFGIFVLPAAGGETRRLTYHAEHCMVVGWYPDSDNIMFLSALESPHARALELFKMSRLGGGWSKIPVGPASHLAFAPDTEHVCLQRGYVDLSIWKRYRGGRLGQLWYGSLSQNSFIPLSKPDVSETLPFIHQNRIYFVSDRDGIGNIYSYQTDGNDLRQHTFHKDFYVRWPSLCQDQVVYQCGGDLWKMHLGGGEPQKLSIQLYTSSYSWNHRFVSPGKYLQNYSLSPKGDQLLFNIRGQLLVAPPWKGANKILGEAQGVRHRLCRWLPDNQRIIACNDAGGEEQLVLYDLKDGACTNIGNLGHQGYFQQILPSPNHKDNTAAVSVASHLYLLHLDNMQTQLVDRSNHRYFHDFIWSPDGRWLAYTKFQGEPNYASLFMYDTKSQKSTQLTAGDSHDYSPFFDPQGRYLYFLSKRVFNPYEDSLQVAYSFPATAKPYLIVLKSLVPSPFSPMAEWSKEEKDNGKKPEEKEKETEIVVDIDLEGIERRVQEVPIQEGRFLALMATKDKLLLLKKPVMGILSESSFWQESDKPTNQLIGVNLKDPKEEVLFPEITSFSCSYPYKKMVVKIGHRLRIVNTGEEPPKDADARTIPKTGWLDLDRNKVMIEPKAEWRQILREGWRWQRDFYWRSDMNGIDWPAMYRKYEPLLPKIRSREELSDLLWEMQGELGTSHAYAIGGDVTFAPNYAVGSLGADLEWDAAKGKYRFVRIYLGDLYQKDKHSPLAAPGVEVPQGSYLLAINGKAVDSVRHPHELLLNLAGTEVCLKISPTGEEADAREVVITTLRYDGPVRYHQWVEDNRKYVVEKTQGKVGYLHLPDMEVAGLVAFHRDFLWQFHKDGLILDVRFNSGGHVSPVFLAKLQSKVIGYTQPRYGELEGFPYQAIRGPVVTICNEYTGSDGDIFCQAFKDLRLGTLIGKRTWGGIIGMIGDKRLVDGGLLTQPEFAFWFKSNGWGVENHGVEPDIEVENDPACYSEGKDRQLDRGIEVILQQMAQAEHKKP